MMNSSLKNWLKKGYYGTTCWLISSAAFASTNDEGLEFVTTTQKIEKAISGPWVMSASIIMVVVTCLMLAFGEFGEGFKKIINIIMWLSIALSASSFLTAMFGSGAVC